jgi:glutaredoxin 2
VGKKKESTKKIKKRMDGYQKVIEGHREKIVKDDKSPAVPHWEKEIKAAQDKFDKLGRRLKRRKKRGS